MIWGKATATSSLQRTSIHAGNVTTGQLQRFMSLNTSSSPWRKEFPMGVMWLSGNWKKELSMQGMSPTGTFKGWSHSTLSSYTWRKKVLMQGVGPSDNFKGWYHSTLVICTWKIIHAGNVTIRQQIRVIALDTSKLFIKERSIRKECDHQAFSNDDLTQHLILSLFISNNHLWFSNGTRFSHQHHIIQFGTPNIP